MTGQLPIFRSTPNPDCEAHAWPSSRTPLARCARRRRTGTAPGTPSGRMSGGGFWAKRKRSTFPRFSTKSRPILALAPEPAQGLKSVVWASKHAKTVANTRIQPIWTSKKVSKNHPFWSIFPFFDPLGSGSGDPPGPPWGRPRTGPSRGPRPRFGRPKKDFPKLFLSEQRNGFTFSFLLPQRTQPSRVHCATWDVVRMRETILEKCFPSSQDSAHPVSLSPRPVRVGGPRAPGCGGVGRILAHKR